jgi:hypothetical protein
VIRPGAHYDVTEGWAREPRLTPILTVPRRHAPRRVAAVTTHAGAFIAGLMAGAAIIVALLARGLP